jgi:cation diffusion facilitator family transporter
MPPSETAQFKARNAAARLSVIVGVLLLAVKMTAFLLTNSTAILSDALESVVHVGAVLFMYYCLRVAARPPDADHPYGHGKVEYFSVGFEGGMVLLTALTIFWQAGQALYFKSVIVNVDIGMALTAVAAVVNAILGCHLVRVGRAHRSVILVADGKHVLSDVYTSAGAFIGLFLLWKTGAQWLDGVTAIVLSGVIAITALRLLREAINGLMDQVDPKGLRAVVDAVNEIRAPEWLGVHNLRLRTSGDFIYADFHLIVPSQWTVADAHESIEKLEHHILARLNRQGAVMIHLDHPHDGASDQPQPITVESATRFNPT